MNTVIKINGLDVEMCDETPTKPGVYWFRARYDLAPSLMDVRGGDDGTLFVPGEGLIGGQWIGVWSAPLVPAVEVEKAYRDGLEDCAKSDGHTSKGAMADWWWRHSRAKRVTEGGE